MIIFPAIDLRQGRCVRLRQGDPQAETVFGDDPVAMAQHWIAQGAEWLHIVNLDGALGATRNHLTTLQRPSSIRIQHPGQAAPETPEQLLARELPVNLRCLRAIARAVTTPIQFGGGLRTIEDIQLALELGAARVVLGTVAVENPGLGLRSDPALGRRPHRRGHRRPGRQGSHPRLAGDEHRRGSGTRPSDGRPGR